MKKGQIFISALLILGVFLNISCNKTKQGAKRLSGEAWEIKKISIDGKAAYENIEVHLEFDNCDIYDEICKGELEIGDDHADFVWQIREKGAEFLFSNQSEEGHKHVHKNGGHSHGSHLHNKTSAAQLGSEISGKYSIEEFTKTELIIKSNETIGHLGEVVEIILKKD